MEVESKESILFKPTAIALLVNEHALADLRIFLYTLQLWNTATTLPTLYIYCTKKVHDKLPSFKYSGIIHTSISLEQYANLSRKQMELLSSRHSKRLSNLFHDFTVEKCNLMEWAIKKHGSGILFCDADILWLGPLPDIPNTIELGLSLHEIQPKDEQKYGIYNAGFLYIQSVDIVEIWRNESFVSKFFEQLALEEVAKYVEPYIFGRHINYGWWRMFQAPVSYTDRVDEWSIDHNETTSGLCVKGEPVVCIHTHWKTDHFMTITFNTWINKRLHLLKTQPKVVKLLQFLEKS